MLGQERAVKEVDAKCPVGKIDNKKRSESEGDLISRRMKAVGWTAMGLTGTQRIYDSMDGCIEIFTFTVLR